MDIHNKARGAVHNGPSNGAAAPPLEPTASAALARLAAVDLTALPAVLRQQAQADAQSLAGAILADQAEADRELCAALAARDDALAHPERLTDQQLAAFLEHHPDRDRLLATYRAAATQVAADAAAVAEARRRAAAALQRDVGDSERTLAALRQQHAEQQRASSEGLAHAQRLTAVQAALDRCQAAYEEQVMTWLSTGGSPEAIEALQKQVAADVTAWQRRL